MASYPEPLIVRLAADIAKWFPSLEGRSIAVSEISVFQDRAHVPTLPLAAVALIREKGKQSKHGGSQIELNDEIIVQFMFKSQKYLREDGSESPFFAFYDYESLRDELLRHTVQWRTPRGGSISFQSLDINSDEMAVLISMIFETNEKWCSPPPEATNDPNHPDYLSQPFSLNIAAAVSYPICL